MNWLLRADRTGVPLLIARLALGAMMVRMGWSKVGQPVEFLKLLDQYHMFPPGWYLVQNLIAVCLPWIEVLGGVLLIAGLFTRGNALLFLILLTAFTIVITARAVNIHTTQAIPYSQIHFDCGCGGGDVYFKVKVPENAILWLFAWIGLLSRSRRFALDGLLFSDRRAAAPDAHGATAVASRHH